LTFGALFSGDAQAQTELVFSVDWQGQTVGAIDSLGGIAITDADLLIPVGGPFPSPTAPLEEPGILLPGAFLQAYSACQGHLPGASCGIEINALSYGRDALLQLNPNYRFGLYFSVDEHAVGAPSIAPWGTVFGEALQNEASADIFVSHFQGPGPFGPGGPPGENVQVMDGDGRRNQGSAFAPGLGLKEPNPAGNTLPDLGSNLDALNLGTPLSLPNDKIYFSLQGGIIDPLEAVLAHTDSAQQQGHEGADILVFDPLTGQVSVYATADSLGLNMPGGVDDVDAIAVVEINNIPGFQRPNAMYDWQIGGGDLVLFSVRRGSSIIGTPDSILGLPIVPGDVLIAPFGQGFLGTTPPGIFATGESLGLSVDRLNATSDELDAIDVLGGGEDPFKDCNNTGIEDGKDISNGSSPDDNINGIPDECEDPGKVFCDCKTSMSAPCGNNGGVDVGCLNNTGVGGKLVGTGQSSIATDSLVLTTSLSTTLVCCSWVMAPSDTLRSTTVCGVSMVRPKDSAGWRSSTPGPAAPLPTARAF
ncbi:MAG: hypothetical protein P1V35_06065, partial [Planctomycetota bacterium]|nr:hypothetical protein [Planctomycetota bacterium]